MIVSYAREFIFLKTQKCAGSSVELALSQICGPDDVITPLPAADEAMRTGRGPQNCDIAPDRRPPAWRLLRALGVSDRKAGTVFHEHMNARDIRAGVGAEVFDRYRKITIVRNAWDREVSLYFWATRDLTEKPTFDRFVRRHVSRPERKTWEIYTLGDRVVADTVMRFETLEQDFAAFLSSIGQDDQLALPRAKGAFRPKKKRDFREFYTPDTVEVVRRRYAREIGHFEMTFDA